MINYSDYLDYVSQNPWLNVVSAAFGLIGIILAIVFYIKGKKSKKPIYRIKNVNLIKENISKMKSIDIQYHGNKIDNLSISKVVIWNAGEETINNTDLVDKDIFRIEIDQGFKILGYELIFQKNPANDFKLTQINDNVLKIDFNYFDYEEGIIVEIYHTAITKDFLNVKGSLKGAKKIMRNESGKEIFTLFGKIFNFINSISDFIIDYLFKKRIYGLFLSLLPILSIIYTTLLLETMDMNTIKIFMITVNVILVVVCVFLFYVFTKIKVPKDFDLFESEF